MLFFATLLTLSLASASKPSKPPPKLRLCAGALFGVLPEKKNLEPDEPQPNPVFRFITLTPEEANRTMTVQLAFQLLQDVRARIPFEKKEAFEAEVTAIQKRTRGLIMVKGIKAEKDIHLAWRQIQVVVRKYASPEDINPPEYAVSYDESILRATFDEIWRSSLLGSWSDSLKEGLAEKSQVLSEQRRNALTEWMNSQPKIHETMGFSDSVSFAKQFGPQLSEFIGQASNALNAKMESESKRRIRDVAADKSLRFIFEKFLSDPLLRVIEPVKPNKYGEQMLVAPDMQLAVWYNRDGSIKAAKVLFLNERDILGKIGAFQDLSFHSVLPVQSSSPMRASPTPATKASVSEVSEDVVVPVVAEPLHIESIGLSPELLGRLNDLNDQYPGRHEFLREAAKEFLARHEFQAGDPAERALRKLILILKLEDIPLEDRMRQLRQVFEQEHQRADRVAAQEENRKLVAETPQKTAEITLNDLLSDPNFDVSQLKAGQPYTVTFLLQPNWGLQTVVFEKAALDYMRRHPLPGRQSWLDLFCRGVVPPKGQEGIEVLFGADDVRGYRYAIKHIATGGHDRMGIVQEGKIWRIMEGFEARGPGRRH